MSIPIGYWRLTAEHPTTKEDLRVEALFGDGVPTVTGGYAVWQTTTRPRRRSLTDWNGSEPLALSWPFMIDGFALTHSIEDDCRTLEIMAGLIGDGVEPPLCKLDSGGFIPHDVVHASQNRWFISGLTWGDSITDHKGDRTRQEGTLEVTEYVQDDVVQSLSAAGKNRAAVKKGGIRSKPYIVKRGDTLRKIAASQLKNAHRWHEIAKLNKIRDPKSIKVGQHLKLPR